MAVPLLNWLRAKGVEFRLRSKVIGLGFESGSDKITVNSLEYVSEEATTTWFDQPKEFDKDLGDFLSPK
jgi:hypothetical protein